MAGVLVSAKEGNRVRYRLTDSRALERVLHPIPSAPGRWHLRLPVIAAFVDLSGRLAGRDAMVQGVEARKTLEAWKSVLAAAGITSSGPSAIAETYWFQLQRWLIENVIADDSKPPDHLAGMLEGAWIAPNESAPAIWSASGAVLPRTAANPNDRQLICLDLVQAPAVAPATDCLWAVLSNPATTTYAHTIGLTQREQWRFVTRQFGDERTYAVEYADPLPHDRISRLYGKTAAARARSDHPAVQLRLTRLGAE